MRPHKERGPLAGGPLGGWQHAEEDELSAVSIDLTGVRVEALRGWASCLLAHVARERLSGGIKPAELEDVREVAQRTLAEIRERQ
jgi:hypothetical protein